MPEEIHNQALRAKKELDEALALQKRHAQADELYAAAQQSLAKAASMDARLTAVIESYTPPFLQKWFGAHQEAKQEHLDLELMYAVCVENTARIEYLVKQGAQLRPQNLYLDLAGAPELSAFEMALELGAIKSAVFIANHEGHSNITDILKSYGEHLKNAPKWDDFVEIFEGTCRLRSESWQQKVAQNIAERGGATIAK